ncbi:MAG: IPExxxVDY family protein [Bacteroidales bacterium]|nr:IPExxxVDY family protein [Bacteroidales bacterium]
MAKKLKLEVDYSEDYRILGVSSHLKDYRIAFFLNKVLEFDLRKTTDFLFQQSANQPALNYSFYHYRTPDAWFVYSMIGNFNAYGRLIVSLWQYDYIIFVNGPSEDHEIETSLKAIRSIQHVLTASEIPFDKVKNINHIIADIEMHLINNKLIN